VDIFGSATRFAGDHLSAAYNSVDGKLGGFLPGGVEGDGVDLVKEVARDALPGQRIHGEKLTEKAKGTAGDLLKGRADLAATRARSGAVGGKVREHFVEEGIERIGREAVERIATRGGAYAIPVAGQLIATADTVNDAFGIADTVLTATSGKGTGQHVDQTIAMRNRGRQPESLFPQARQVGDDIHEVNQSKPVNPSMQEIRNRATRVGQKFNPLQGDFGFSEAMGWN
jgi:hypothetical protein